MSLADDLRARMRLIPVHWEQHKLYARALTLAEAVEKLPEPELHYLREIGDDGKQVTTYADPDLAIATEKLKEMIR